MSLPINSNEIADATLQAFEALPTRVKPRRYPNGSREWTTLSGIVISKRMLWRETVPVECVALGTGLRCLPHAKLHLAHGSTLHDWHAEIVAVRALNLFLLQECLRLASTQRTQNSDAGESASGCVRLRAEQERTPDEPQPFAITDGIALHMYSSTAPCGDASMELTMASQADATPWPIAPVANTSNGNVTSDVVSDSNTLLPGRSHFSLLGIVRRKPARADAPPTLSKSCSDKLAMMQCTSLLSGLTSLFIHPGNGYLSQLVIPREEHVPAAMERSFRSSGRLSSLNATLNIPGADSQGSSGATQKEYESSGSVWQGGYAFRPFSVSTSSRNFEYARTLGSSQSKASNGSNITAAWTANMLKTQPEVIINGTLSGHKQFTVRGASSISRRSLWIVASNLARLMSCVMPQLSIVTNKDASYANLKACDALRMRRRIKQCVCEKALRGWTTNSGDDAWYLVDSKEQG